MADYPIYRLVKGSALTYAEMDGNLEWLSTNLSGSNVTISGSTILSGSLAVSGSVATGESSWAVGLGSHAQGLNTFAIGDYSHAQGSATFTGHFWANIVSVDTGNNTITVTPRVNVTSTYFSVGDRVAYTYYANSNENLVYIGTITDVTGDVITVDNPVENVDNSAKWSLNRQGATLYNLSQTGLEGVGWTANSVMFSHAEGSYTAATSPNSHAEGRKTSATGYHSHAEGVQTGAWRIAAHSEGIETNAGTYSENNQDSGGQGSHAEGYRTQTYDNFAHAEGYYTTASNEGSHAEGYYTVSNGLYSHAEGENTLTLGRGAHSEGYFTTASAQSSHAEGESTLALGQGAHSEGLFTTASGQFSHAEGEGTVASANYQHVQGIYNISSSAEAAFIIGNGADHNNRRNLVFASGSQFQVTGSILVSGSVVATQNITASNALITGTITAQTLVVQTITSSIVYSSGSNRFGNELTNQQTFTGSVNITGSLSILGLTITNQPSVVTIDTTTGVLYYTASSAIGGTTLSGGKTNYVTIWNSVNTVTTGSFYQYSETQTQITGSSLAVGTILPSATIGRIDASNDIVAFSTSDIRLKENIQEIKDSLYKLSSISGIEYDWKKEFKDIHGYEGHDVGVIAQEIQSILPEAVRNNESGYLSVRYEKIVPLLIQAIKEQQSQIEDLQDQINILKNNTQ